MKMESLKKLKREVAQETREAMCSVTISGGDEVTERVRAQSRKVAHRAVREALREWAKS